jgi:hypothetical protein
MGDSLFILTVIGVSGDLLLMRKRYYRPARRKKIPCKAGAFILFIVVIAAIVTAAVLIYMRSNDTGIFRPDIDPSPTQTPAPFEPDAGTEAEPPAAVPAAVDITQPSAFGFTTDIQSGGGIVADYNRTDPISFGSGANYTGLKGITTFRGDNYRDKASYGAANITAETLTRMWHTSSGALNGQAGSGWTGQPVMAQWDADMRQIMNLYDDKKAKDTLVEVIYPTLDGKIYFLDLDDGSYTRDPIDMGVSVKGTASLDPRGYPLLYIGQGVGAPANSDTGNEWDNTYMYIYSLIDGQVLWKYGAETQDVFSYRSSGQHYDSSPLVAADADTLIWPGGNGVIYTVVLNSDFDRAAGTVSVSASEPVKYRYTTPQNADNTEGMRGYGISGSAAAWRNYLYFTDSGGWLQCVDLNTMKPVFVQDVGGSSDSSPVLEQDGGNVYLYTGNTAAASGEESGDALCHIRKINGLTGEMIWEYQCPVKASGGIYATPVLGKGDLSGLVIYTAAHTTSSGKGTMIALDKSNGSVVWEQEMKHYALSSPVAVYTSSGKGYILQCDSSGKMTLYDGATGEQLDSVGLGADIEASPSVFNNMAVVGTKGEKIYGVMII